MNDDSEMNDDKSEKIDEIGIIDESPTKDLNQ